VNACPLPRASELDALLHGELSAAEAASLRAHAADCPACALELSWLLAASGTGALAGALVTASLGGLRRRGALLVSAAFAHGVLLMFFGLQHTVVGAMLFVGLTNLAVMVFLGMANTLMQTRTPDAIRGRVMSVHTMIFMGFMPLGQMVLGSVGTLAGINNAFLAGGVVVTLLAGYTVLRVAAVREAMATTRPRAVAERAGS